MWNTPQIQTEDNIEESAHKGEGTTEACGQGCGLQIPCVHSVMRSTLGKQEDT